MAEEHDGGTEPVGDGVERRVAGGARSRLEALPRRAADRHADHVHGIEPEPAQRVGRGRGDVGRPGLEAVVDDDGTGPHPCSGSLERCRRREGQGVGAAAARDEHEVTGA